MNQNKKPFFELIAEDSDSNARAGIISTDNSVIHTPVFMPVGTQGTVKAINHDSLKKSGFGLILGNTYHLYLRPGSEVIKKLGGLHKFINWNRSLLTDSGGYQVFSLKENRSLSEEGVEFKSHIDGSYHKFTPENVVEFQRMLGSDIMMVLDECIQYPADKKYVQNSSDLSLRWAERSKNHFEKTSEKWGHRQFLFGIGQGGMYPDLRKEYIRGLKDIEFDGYAIGGLSVGEPEKYMYEILDASCPQLPKDKPRYLMGVGTPENILEAVERGIDMFDCVLPTRNARNGQLFTSNGKINLRNSKYKFSDNPIDEKIGKFVSSNFSLSYLRHLFISGEILGIMIATAHNLNFYQWLMNKARSKILNGKYRQWKMEFLERYRQNDL